MCKLDVPTFNVHYRIGTTTTKEKIGLTLIGLVGLALLASGIMKFTQPVEMIEAMGSGPLLILGITEMLTVAALIFTPTRLLGIILAASYIGGIIAFSWLVEKETPLIGGDPEYCPVCRGGALPAVAYWQWGREVGG